MSGPQQGLPADSDAVPSATDEVIAPAQPTPHRPYSASQPESDLVQHNLDAAQQALLATQQNLERSQEHLDALTQQTYRAEQRGFWARLFGGRSKTIVKVQVKNAGNTITTSPAPKRDLGQHMRELIEDGAPRVLEFLLSLNPTQAVNLYNKADGDFGTVIQLCTQVQQSLNSRLRPDAGSLQVAFAAYEGMAASLRRTIWAYASEILQTNPEVPVVRPDRMPVAPRETTLRRRKLSPEECQVVADAMTTTVQGAIDTLRRIQQGLRDARATIADPRRVQTLAGAMRDSDLYPIVTAVNQANALAIQLHEAQDGFFRRLYEVPNAHKRFWRKR